MTCPRCHNPLILGEDGWGTHYRCLICGVYQDVGKVVDEPLWFAAEAAFPPLTPLSRVLHPVPKLPGCL